MQRRLYGVRLVGLHGSLGSDTDRGDAYVVANNPDEAYKAVRAFLDHEDLGFEHERQLDLVKLLAEEGRYPRTKYPLFIVENNS